MAGLSGLLVEDQSMFVELLLPVLQAIAGLRVVATAGTAEEAMAAVQQLRPDLLILDLCLPDLPGIHVAEALQRVRPEAHLIVLSGQASSFLCPPALKPMLHAVVDKTSAFRELQQEIHHLLGRQLPVDLPRPSASMESGTATATLTQRERDVLALLGQGCSSRAIAETLGIAETTVQTHRRSLREKLGVSGPRLMRLAVMQSLEG